MSSTDFEKRDISELRSIWGRYLNDLQDSSKGFKNEIQVINTVEETKKACEWLKGLKDLAFDCKGVRLGRGGKRYFNSWEKMIPFSYLMHCYLENHYLIMV